MDDFLTMFICAMLPCILCCYFAYIGMKKSNQADRRSARVLFRVNVIIIFATANVFVMYMVYLFGKEIGRQLYLLGV